MTPTLCEPQGVVNVSVKLPRVLFTDKTEKVLPVDLVTVKLFGPSLKSTVPLGLTVKLTVPLPCFENDIGLGLVVTVTTHGVGVGSAPGDAPGLAPGDADGEADGLAPGLAPGLADGLAAGLAPGDASGDALGLAPGDALGDALGDAPGDGCGDGLALLLPMSVEPPSIPLRFEMALTFGTSSR